MYPGYNVIINTILAFVRLRNSSSTQTEQACNATGRAEARGSHLEFKGGGLDDVCTIPAFMPSRVCAVLLHTASLPYSPESAESNYREVHLLTNLGLTLILAVSHSDWFCLG